MADESNVLPTSRLVRWITIGVLLLVAIGLYLRDGRTLPPLTASPASPPPPAPDTVRSPH